MDKAIDLSKTVYELHKSNPEILDIMKDIGFEDITKPGMINTAGRFMTIYKGAKMKNINLDEIKNTFKQKGYEIIE